MSQDLLEHKRRNFTWWWNWEHKSLRHNKSRIRKNFSKFLYMHPTTLELKNSRMSKFYIKKIWIRRKKTFSAVFEIWIIKVNSGNTNALNTYFRFLLFHEICMYIKHYLKMGYDLVHMLRYKMNQLLHSILLILMKEKIIINLKGNKNFFILNLLA